MKSVITGCLLALSSYGLGQQASNNTINNISNLRNMENEAKIVVTEFLTAVQQGNMEKVGALVSPDIEWVQPGSNRVSGVKRSNTEVFGMIGKMFELSDSTLKLTSIKSISVNGNKVACLLHWNAAQPAGGILDVNNIDVYTVENGLITKAEIFTSDLEQENKFWGE
jgi:ketosteroid isomerase-like protein